MDQWRFTFLMVAAAIAIAAAQMNMFCELSKGQLEIFMDCGKDGFSSEASSGWSTCREEVLQLPDVNVTDTQALIFMCEQNKTRAIEDCMKKSGKKVNRKARAKMMVCMMRVLT